MGKKQMSKTAKVVEPPGSLTMSLFAPGMTMLHRAGLGGLASSLRYIERAWLNDVILTEELPGGPWVNGNPPWEVTPRSITLRFGDPKEARTFFQRLFRLSFRLKDGLLHLPGQYGDMPPSLAVRAEIQAGLTLTFLQHGKTRKLAKNPISYQVDPEGDGRPVTIEYKTCEWYKHQDGWIDLTEEKTGFLTVGSIEVIGPLNPGAVVRHVKFSRDTRIEEPPERALPLYFALVGCLALSVNRGMGVLLVPDVEDLRAFAVDRPLMTPASMKECRIASASDAALQAQVRLRARGVLDRDGLPACNAARFRPTTWASQQKSRVEAITMHRLDALRRKRVKETHGTGRAKQTVEVERFFWADSVVRPLIADNLARGERWYHDFTSLCRTRETAKKLGYERLELQTMADTPLLTDEDENHFIRAIHRAIFVARGKIYSDTVGVEAARRRVPATDAVHNRWNRYMERLRLDLVGAKTANQVLARINELLVRAATVAELRDDQVMLQVKRLLFGADWQRIRSLAMFAVASYKRPLNVTPLPGDEDELSEARS
jgi:CRISPR-associated protein Cas8a1/Csx13